MIRVFVWMIAGTAIGYLAMTVLATYWVDRRHPMYRDPDVWLLVAVTGIVTGAMLGTLFGVADAILRSNRQLLAELRSRPPEETPPLPTRH